MHPQCAAAKTSEIESRLRFSVRCNRAAAACVASAAPFTCGYRGCSCGSPAHRGGLCRRGGRAQQPRGLQVAQQALQQQQAPLRRPRAARRAAATNPARDPAGVQRCVQVRKRGVQGARPGALGRHGLHLASGRLLPPRPGRRAASSGRRLRRGLRGLVPCSRRQSSSAASRLLGGSAFGCHNVHLAPFPFSSASGCLVWDINIDNTTTPHLLGKQSCRVQACRLCTSGRCAALPRCLPRPAHEPEGQGPRRRRRRWPR